MNAPKITQTVIHYLAENFENLENTMPNERYFLIKGATINERGFRANLRFAIGTSVDVLADIIEKRRFFGWHVPETVYQATNQNNAKLVPLNDGEEVSGSFELKFTKNGLFVAAEKVESKLYLRNIKNPMNFKLLAQVLGVEGDLEKIISTIFSFD